MLSKPLTKEAIADIMSVSVRTIANWMSDGTLPKWHYIGRRVYWHPEQFQRWLDMRLSESEEAATTAPPYARVLSDAVTAPTPKRGRPRRSGRA